MRCPSCGSRNIQGVDACENCGSDLAGWDLPGAGRGFSGRLLSDRIGDLDLSPALTVAPDATVAESIHLMRERRSGCVLVVRDGELEGLFNERHVLTRVLRSEVDPATTPVSNVMSTEPLRLDPDDPPAFAVHCMVSRGFRHLPVVQGDELLGYVSVRNILAYLHRDVISG